MMSHVQVPSKNAENSFTEGKGKLGGLRVNKEPTDFHWLSSDSTGSSCQEEKRKPSSYLLGSAYCHRA